MSNSYERNTGMVACIIAVLIVGAIGVGAITYFGTTNWNWSQATTDFSFEAEVGATTGTVTLDVDLDSGGVSIQFVDNASLLYDFDIEALNRTVDQYGPPAVSFAGNKIIFDYAGGEVNITLGSGVNYTMDVHVQSGGLALELGAGAHIGDVNATATSGGLALVVTDDVVLLGSPDFYLNAVSGAMTLVIDLPTGVGGSVECAVTSGTVSITAPSWNEITSNHYETSDYDTALQTLTIIAEVTSGAFVATLT
jgi:hypothetical protein